MTNSEQAPNEPHPPGKDHHQHEHQPPPAKEVAQGVPPLQPNWLKDILDNGGEGGGANNDGYERERARNLPAEEKEREKDKDRGFER